MTAVQPYRGSYLMPAFEHATVVDVMRPGAMTCAPDAPLIQVAQTMATNHVHCVVVGGMTRDDAGGEHLVSDMLGVRPMCHACGRLPVRSTENPGVSSSGETQNRSTMRILTVIVLLVALAGCPSAAAARPPAFVALGDSLAMPEGSYVDVAFAQLRTAGRWRVQKLVKLAQASETTRTILRGQLRSAVRVIRRRDTNVRVVTVDIGANDGRPGLRCLVGTGIPPCSEIPGAETARACLLAPARPPCAIRPNVARLLHALKKALAADPGRETIVLLGIPNPWSGTGQPLEPIVDRALFGEDRRSACTQPEAPEGLNDLFACAAGGPVRFIDTQPAFAGRGPQLTNVAFGDPHFNQAGAQAAGLAIVHELRPAG